MLGDTRKEPEKLGLLFFAPLPQDTHHDFEVRSDFSLSRFGQPALLYKQFLTPWYFSHAHLVYFLSCYLEDINKVVIDPSSF